MDIVSALKETGKAQREHCKDWFIEKEAASPSHYKITYADGSDGGKTMDLHNYFKDDWQPYHPKEEIRPSEAGELWEIRGMKCFTVRQVSGLELIDELGVSLIIENTIHEKYGCARLLPPVSDGEEIVIEGVRWLEIKDPFGTGKSLRVTPDTLGSSYHVFESLLNKPPMTMTLTMPKEA